MSEGWFEKSRRSRARRALERQLDYQENKAASFADSDAVTRNTFLRSQVVRQKLSNIRPLSDADKVLEVGGGAHGLVFGLGNAAAISIDPLAVEYKRLFPKWQQNATSVAAVGEQLPFGDSSFDVVLSDNVIDHAHQPIRIIHEMVRVMKPSGLLYFTVNVHHPLYDVVSQAHGWWNALGVRFELSAFADHTVHFTESAIRKVFEGMPIRPVSQISRVAETRRAQRRVATLDPEALLKKVFFKNAIFEIVGIKL